jgi:hypothetical protein
MQDRRQAKRWYRWILRFVFLFLGCILASVASAVFLPTVEIHTRYPLRSFNLSGYIGMFIFSAVVFALQTYRGRLKSAWPECFAALALAMLITLPTWWIIGMY